MLKFKYSLRKSTVKRRFLILLGAVIVLTGCQGKTNVEEADGEPAETDLTIDADYDASGFDGVGAKTDLTIDSSYSGSDTSFVVEDYNFEAVEEIFIYINAGTASGKSYLVTREDEEYFNDILNMFWNSDNSFSATESGYDDYDYNYYVSLKCTDEAEDITIFVFDVTLIRINGIFYRCTVDLDYDPVINLRAFCLD